MAGDQRQWGAEKVRERGGGQAGNLIRPDHCPVLGILPMHEFYTPGL